jgi:hypothetical protein
MKYITRIIASPFVFCMHFIASTYIVFRNTFNFVKYGGEWISYVETDKNTIIGIYNKLKSNHTL